MNYFLIFLLLSGYLFASILNTQIKSKLYTQVGEYTLTPEDYEYSSNLIISIWGAGSGSSFSRGYEKSGQTIYCPGNSGSYINFNIETNNDTFYFSLGAGGYSSLISDTWAQDGNYSAFWVLSSESKLHLIALALGGYANGTKQIHPLSSSLSRGIGKEEEKANYLYERGIVYDCYAWNNVPNNGYGAHSPYGHEGGNFNAVPKCDGYMGSGSGYNCCYCMVDKHNACIRPYKGGDGALEVYFST